jgi:hypothetical protein
MTRVLTIRQRGDSAARRVIEPQYESGKKRRMIANVTAMS